MILTQHGILSLNVRDYQLWTTGYVPDDTYTEHDFGDGLGPVLAVPYDSGAVSTDIIEFIEHDVERAGISTDIISFIENGTEHASVSTDIIEFIENGVNAAAVSVDIVETILNNTDRAGVSTDLIDFSEVSE